MKGSQKTLVKLEEEEVEEKMEEKRKITAKVTELEVELSETKLKLRTVQQKEFELMTQWKEEQVERRRLEIQLAEDREEFRKVSLQMQESFEKMQKQILQKPDAAHRQQIAAKELEIELLKAKVAALEEKDTNSQKLLESFKVECDYVT